MRFDPVAKGSPWHEDVRTLAVHLRHGPLERPLCELVEARVSQINGCAWCLKYHLGRARREGIGQDKLDTLAAWREDQGFTSRERAALGLAEVMTRVGEGRRVDEPTWEASRKEF